MLRVEVEENFKITLFDMPSSTAPNSMDNRSKEFNCNDVGNNNGDVVGYVRNSPLLIKRTPHVNNKTNDNIIVEAASSDDDSEEKIRKSFSQNRDLWQQRASSHGSVDKIDHLCTAGKEMRDMRQKHTPDLVIDLPIQDCSVKSPEELQLDGGNESSSEPESPDMTLAAERFAKQNQCTLKKNNKSSSTSSCCDSFSSGGGGNKTTNDMMRAEQARVVEEDRDGRNEYQVRTPILKPHLRKPQLYRKPVLSPVPPPSLHNMLRKDNNNIKTDT